MPSKRQISVISMTVKPADILLTKPREESCAPMAQWIFNVKDILPAFASYSQLFHQQSSPPNWAVGVRVMYKTDLFRSHPVTHCLSSWESRDANGRTSKLLQIAGTGIQTAKLGTCIGQQGPVHQLAGRDLSRTAPQIIVEGVMTSKQGNNF